MPREIMYIGKKPTKRDNINDVPSRVWNGLGDVQTVTDAEAIKLTLPLYADVWMDVTKLSEEERSKIVSELRAKYREEQRRITPAGDVAKALGVLSTEELEKELRRRRRQDGQADQNPAPAPTLAAHPQGKATETEETERPSSTEDVVLEIAGVIAALDKENRSHFDSEGNPVLETVIAKLGYKVSQSELKAAVDVIRG